MASAGGKLACPLQLWSQMQRRRHQLLQTQPRAIGKGDLRTARLQSAAKDDSHHQKVHPQQERRNWWPGHKPEEIKLNFYIDNIQLVSNFLALICVLCWQHDQSIHSIIYTPFFTIVFILIDSCIITSLNYFSIFLNGLCINLTLLMQCSYIKMT